MPCCVAKLPLAAMVTIPCTKSVGAAGIGIGSQRNWFGGVATSLIGPLRSNPSSMRRKSPCTTEGRMR